MSRGLLTHLADRFVDQREDLATEALSFILQSSIHARAEMARVINDMGCNLTGDPNFRTQVSGDSRERPDLTGWVNGYERILVEAKFWAGLTDHQPVTYIERLEGVGQPGALVFIAPEQRMELLWVEIEKRIRASGRTLDNRSVPFPGSFAAGCGSIRLGAVSWTALLSRLERALAASGERELLESLGQLQVLCEREERDAFLPVTGEELTNSLPRRLLQYGQLVDDVTVRLVAQGLADTSGLRASAGNGWYGRYVRIHGCGCLLFVNAEGWANLESTPFWMRLNDANWEVSPALRAALERAQSDGILRFYAGSRGIEVPLDLALGRDRSGVLDHLLGQVTNVASILAKTDLPPPRQAAGYTIE